MRSRTSTSVRAGAVVAVLAPLIVLLASCGTDSGPRGAAQRFLDAFGQREYADAAQMTTAPDRAQPTLKEAWSGLKATGMTAHTGRVRENQDIADVDVTYDWTLDGNRTWSYPARLTMGRSDTGWSVRWASTVVHPELGADQTLALSVISPPRGAVNEADGSEVMGESRSVGISFDAQAAALSGPVIDSVNAMVNVLNPLVPGLSAQAIAEKSTASDQPIPIGDLSGPDYDRLRQQLDIPGVVATEKSSLAPVDPGFASALLAQVRTRVTNDGGGTPGWQVSVLNDNGVVADVVEDHAAVPSPAVRLTLSRHVQNAAQQAVNAVSRQAMMVVLQASTGKILAVAQNPAADRDGLLATMGTYPPGSTFKMVTASAAMSAHLTDPQAMVPCPGEITIGTRVVPNYDGFSLGTVPLTEAFAQSCNTTFANLAGQMGASDLSHAATAMGLGAQYSIAGIDAKSGSVPIEPDLVRRAEDGFGQGTVLATPLGMAVVAATADTGKPPTPLLIEGTRTTVEGPKAELASQVYDQLRPMMRAVVTSGTATSIAGQGEVYGKTGEAEFNGGSHAWFAGYRGDLAFATLIVGGGDSTNSVNVTRDFFSFLGPGG
ncbi:MAG: penicillin-binding transpeptidase domain-containing protein [Gordonia sp. (in: high G+C Gram-positive bacteria)]|uniref:penicillin-binding transpeptidase domain-containing protein n=1 Tax=Gordonia sp. (in: high G+C Gram-positive bacteria) TaxID=84139 RepID=UPI0039E3B534